jgi:TPR repeat protein
MTSDIKVSAPPPVPPRHNKEYYEDAGTTTKKTNIPPVTPKRITSRVSESFNEDKNGKNTLTLESKEFESTAIENEIMEELNRISDKFKLSEDKLTLYEEENEEKKTELSTNASKSLSSLTINDESHVQENTIEDIPSDSEDSFKSLPKNSNEDSVSSSTSLPLPPVKSEEKLETSVQPEEAVKEELKEESVEPKKESEEAIKSKDSETSEESKPQVTETSEESKPQQVTEESLPQESATESQPQSQSQSLEAPKEKEHLKKSKSKSKSKSSKSSKSKSKEEKEHHKKSKKSKEEKSKSKKKTASIQSPIISITHANEDEVKSLREQEKTQRAVTVKEQEKLGELNQKQYLLSQHQYNLALSQKKQYAELMQNNNLEQLAFLQQQHERENASIQQNQNDLTQKVLAQQQLVSEAIDKYNVIVRKLIHFTGEPFENYALPPLPLNPHPFPNGPANQSSVDTVSTSKTGSMNSNGSLTVNGYGSNGNSAPGSPNLLVSVPSNNTRKVSSPVMSPSMSPALSPVINSSYYDEGVYSVSGFSIISGNTSVSEDFENVSILTDQIQQSINRRPTFQHPSSSFYQKIRIGGSDPETFQTTLNAYRQNVKNASDPGLQFEYAKFLIEAANDQYENGSTDSANQHKNDLFDEGFKFLKKLSNAGYPDAQHYLATCYKQDGDWDKAYPLFLQAAKHNHPIASYEVAKHYESKKNYKKASQYYKKSASQGYPMAMHRLGTAALNGEMHMRKDVKNAVKWLKRSAVVATKENNGAASAYVLSELYENGMPPVVYPDEMYSLELLVQAAELDYPPAQYKLGWCFEYGELGCPTDAVQSIHWFLLAAENNEPNAQFSLAGWYLTGAEGVIEPNDKEAFHWASKAAEQEYVKAEYAVAYFYEMGIGIEKNMDEAMRWYKVAAEHGDERAIKRLEGEPGIINEKSGSNDCKIA